jgi:hypothetical protein
MLVLRAAPPRATDLWLASREDSLPEFVAFTVDPVTRTRIALKVAIDVSEALFEQLEERVAECRVHSDHFARVVAAHTVTGKGFFKEGYERDKELVPSRFSASSRGGEGGVGEIDNKITGAGQDDRTDRTGKDKTGQDKTGQPRTFLVCASAIEIAGRGLPGWVRTTFTSRVVPGAEGVASTVEGAEAFDAGVGAVPPRGGKLLARGDTAHDRGDRRAIAGGATGGGSGSSGIGGDRTAAAARTATTAVGLRLELHYLELGPVVANLKFGDALAKAGDLRLEFLARHGRGGFSVVGAAVVGGLGGTGDPDVVCSCGVLERGIDGGRRAGGGRGAAGIGASGEGAGSSVLVLLMLLMLDVTRARAGK